MLFSSPRILISKPMSETLTMIAQKVHSPNVTRNHPCEGKQDVKQQDSADAVAERNGAHARSNVLKQPKETAEKEGRPLQKRPDSNDGLWQTY
mmetsp:Transcript_29744/g.78485  ORF Transcript_29744/g.78485 Transcript_29744/m.78485 type:complete len:93 (+) Transcript_29744:1332-1610(+)